MLPWTSLRINLCFTPFVWKYRTDIIQNHVYTTGIKYMLMFYHNCFQSSTLLGTTALLFQGVVLIYTLTCNYTTSHFPTSLTTHGIVRLCSVSLLGRNGLHCLIFIFPSFKISSNVSWPFGFPSLWIFCPSNVSWFFLVICSSRRIWD